jgi:prevent-host-death family protein
MAQEKVMPFVEARARLSEIVNHVAERGDTYVIAKREKPIAVIIGVDKYRHLTGTAKHINRMGGRKVLKIGGIGKAVGDIDKAIRALRKSRLEAITKNIP